MRKKGLAEGRHSHCRHLGAGTVTSAYSLLTHSPATLPVSFPQQSEWPSREANDWPVQGPAYNPSEPPIVQHGFPSTCSGRSPHSLQPHLEPLHLELSVVTIHNIWNLPNCHPVGLCIFCSLCPSYPFIFQSFAEMPPGRLP